MPEPSVTAQQLRNARAFRDLPPAALDELAAHSRIIELPAGSTLFEQDDVSDALYILEEGQVHIIRQHPTGERVVLVTEVPYYVIGELSTLSGDRRIASVDAVTDSLLVRIERSALLEVCARLPEVATTMMTHLSHRLFRLNLMVREHALGNAPARMASLILLLAQGRDAPIEAGSRLNRIARAIALDSDAAERILKEWDEQGLIAFKNGQITIQNAAALKSIAG